MMKKNDLKQNRKKVSSQVSVNKLPPVNKKGSSPQINQLLEASYQDQGLVSLIHQYFIKHQLIDTIQCFQTQCNKGFKSSTKFQHTLKEQIVETFDKGNRDGFLNKFNIYVPITLRHKDLTTIGLQFYINVYFFIYNIHPNLGKKKIIDNISKTNFTSYLEHRGQILAKSDQFKDFYRLPYLQKPQEDSDFKFLFTKQWINQLRKKLIYYLDKLYPPGKKPTLVGIYDKFLQRSIDNRNHNYQQEIKLQQPIEEQIQQDESMVKQNQRNTQVNQLLSQISQLQSQKTELVHVSEEMKKKYQSLQNSYKDFVETAQNTLTQSQVKWFQIAQEFFTKANDLLVVCKNLQEGIPLQDPNIITIISNKLSKYQSFINMNIQDLVSQNVDFSLFERNDNDASTDLIRKNTQYKGGNHLIQLNYSKIAQCFNDQNQFQDKCLLLQALRWRITKTRGGISKRQVIISYVLFDILGLKRNDLTLKSLLRSPNGKVSVLTVKLLSCMARDFYGRQYMVFQLLLKQCIQLMKDETIDDKIRIYVIITLQQVSFKSKAQLVMIENDLIKWLVQKMSKQRQTMPSYSMEYLSALLLNLLLRKQGLQKSEEIKDEILMALINLMEYQVMDVRSYVHGALYPLLSRKCFRDKAKEYGMEQNIKYLMNNNPPSAFMNQLKYIQQRLKMQQDNIEQDDDEGDNDVDDFFDQQIQDDYQGQDQINGPLTGEQFLMKNFSLIGPQTISQISAIRQQVEKSLKRKSVLDTNSFYERSSANTPMMGNMRRNISVNNSVYSNKSNRVLRTQNKNNEIPNKIVDRLDTVHQNNSQISMKEFNQQRGLVEQQLIDGENQQKRQQNLYQPARNQKVYEKSKDYKQTFQTRSKLVRTPPQK